MHYGAVSVQNYKFNWRTAWLCGATAMIAATSVANAQSPTKKLTIPFKFGDVTLQDCEGAPSLSSPPGPLPTTVKPDVHRPPTPLARSVQPRTNSEGQSQRVIILFKDPLAARQRQSLSGLGMGLGPPIQGDTYHARIKRGAPVPSTATDNAILKVVPINKIAKKSRNKFDPALPAKISASYDSAKSNVIVKFFEDANLEQAQRAIGTDSAVVNGSSKALHALSVSATGAALQMPSDRQDVRFIELARPAPRAYIDGIRNNIGLDMVLKQFRLSGKGIRGGMWDRGTVEKSHPGFGSRITIAEVTVSVNTDMQRMSWCFLQLEPIANNLSATQLVCSRILKRRL